MKSENILQLDFGDVLRMSTKSSGKKKQLDRHTAQIHLPKSSNKKEPKQKVEHL